MSVRELIHQLQQCPPEAEAFYFKGFDEKLPIAAVSPEDSDGDVVIGNDLPPEVYSRDYKAE